MVLTELTREETIESDGDEPEEQGRKDEDSEWQDANVDADEEDFRACTVHWKSFG